MSRISIIRGRAEHLLPKFRALSQDIHGKSIWLGKDSSYTHGIPRYWESLRALFPQLRLHLGKTQFEYLVSQNLVSASLLLRNLDTRLTSSEIKERASLFAEIDSNLSHNHFIQEPFYISLKTFLLALLGQFQGNILIPRISDVDPSTISLFMHSLGSMSDMNIHVYVGLDQQYDHNWFYRDSSNEQLDLDENGLQWNYRSTTIKNIVYTCIHHGAKFEVRDETIDELKDQDHLLHDIDSLDEDLESDLLKQMSDDGLGRVSAGKAIEQIKRSFEVFDFTAALKWAMIVEQRNLELDSAQRSYLHAVMGICAHNRQFSASSGNEATSEFIRSHHAKALENNPSVSRTVTLQYRLAVANARREGKIEEGLMWANRCIENALMLDTMHGKYMLAWAHNIRAYIYARLRKVEPALEDIQEAFDLIKPLSKEVFTSRDVIFSAAVIAENTATIFEHLGDHLKVKYWLSESSKVHAYHKTHLAVGAKSWSDINRKLLRIDLAIPDLKLGLDAASSQARTHHQDLYLNYLRDFNFRLGKVNESLEYVHHTLDLMRLFKDWNRYASVAALGFKYATIAGKLQQVDWFYNQMNKHPHEFTSDNKAIYTAYRALYYAQIGDLISTEQTINRAIELVNQNGNRETMALVLSIIAESCHELGTAEEHEVLDEAFNLVFQDAHEQTSSEVLKITLLLQRLSRQKTGKSDIDDLTYIIKELPGCLERNTELWGYLHKTLSFILDKIEEKELESALMSENFDKILLASSQRRDCRGILGNLMSSRRYNFEERITKIRHRTDGSLSEILDKEFATDVYRFADL